MAPQPQLSLEQQQALAKARARRARETASAPASGVPTLLRRPAQPDLRAAAAPYMAAKDPNAIIRGEKPIEVRGPTTVSTANPNRLSRQLFDSALQDFEKADENAAQTKPGAWVQGGTPEALAGVGKLALSAPMFIADWMQDTPNEEKARQAMTMAMETTGAPAYGRMIDRRDITTGKAVEEGYDPVADLAGLGINALTWSTGAPGGMGAAARDVATNMTMGASDLLASGGKAAVNAGRNIVQKAAAAAPAPRAPSAAAPGQPAAGAASAGTGQGATLATTPVAQPRPAAQVRADKDTAVILTRLMRSAGVSSNDIRAYLPGLVQRFKSGTDGRTPLAFFAESDLVQNFPQEVAEGVIKKLRGFGRERYSADGPKDQSGQIVQKTINELRGSQQDTLSTVMDQNLYKGKLIDAEDKIASELKLNAEAGYRTALDNGRQRLMPGGGAAPEEMAALDEIRTLLANDAFLGQAPKHLKIEAMDEGVPLEEFVQRDPVGAAHWMQSKLGEAARDAYGTPEARTFGSMRKAILKRLETAVPGYKGARLEHGDLFGAEEAIEFGKDLFTAARSEVETARKARAFKQLSKRQQTVATKSIRDALKNEFRGTAEEASAKVTRLQQEGVLDALEKILGADGKRVADGIRRIVAENDRLRAIDQKSGSNTADNLRGAAYAQENVQSPINKLVGDIGGGKKGWIPAMVGDAVLAASGLPPALTVGKIGAEVVDRLGAPSPRQLTNATRGLYELPAQAAPSPPPASGKPRVPRPAAPAATQETLDDLLRQYDAIDHRAKPQESQRLLRKISALKKKLDSGGGQPAATPAQNAFAQPTGNALVTPPDQNAFALPVVGSVGGGTYGYNNAFDMDGDGEISERERLLSGVGGTVLGGVGGLALGNMLKGGRNVAPTARTAGVGGGSKPPRGYPIAPKTEWYGDANYEATGGRLTEMTPDEFLARARPMQIDDVARENIDDLKRHIQSGKTLDPLALYKSGKEDGRHRAIAAKELGIDTVPVLTWDAPPLRGGTPEAMERARKMGFDVDTPLYHGTNSSFDEFAVSERPSLLGRGVYLTPDRELASKYGSQTIEAYARGRFADAGERVQVRKLPGALREILKRNGLRSGSEVSLYDVARMEGGTEALQRLGYAGLNYRSERIVFDPKNIRRTDAAFDPAKSDSANLLAGVGAGSDLRNSLTGAGVGAFGGSAADPEASTEERIRNALIGAAGGAAAGYGAGRIPVRAQLPRGTAQQTFAGVNAKTADMAKLAQAERMAAEGADRRAIWDATGWFKGADGKWRFEIDDSGASISDKTINDLASGGSHGASQRILAGTMKHPALYEAYPQLRRTDADVRFNAGLSGSSGSWSSDEMGVRGGRNLARADVNALDGPDGPLSVLLHEVGGHGVQDIEGFARGGSPSGVAKDLAAFNYQKLVDQSQALMNSPKVKAAQARLDELKAQYSGKSPADIPPEVVSELKAIQAMPEKQELARLKAEAAAMLRKSSDWGAENLFTKDELFDGYRRLAGEAEARNVQIRDAMRRRGETPGAPWETQDVPDDQQIVRFGSQGPQMSAPEKMGFGDTKQNVGPQTREAAARYFAADPARVDQPLSVIARDLNINTRAADLLRTEARGGSRPRSRPRQNAFAEMTGNALTSPAVQGGIGGAAGGVFAGDVNSDGQVSMDERFQSAGLGAVGTIMTGGLMRSALSGDAAAAAVNGVRGAVRRAPVEVTDDLILEAAQKLGPDQFEIWKAATMGRNKDGLPLTNDEIVDLINAERPDATMTRENVRVQLSKIRAKGFDVPDAPTGALSDNTQKLIEMSAQGMRPKDIAERLGMTKNTVGALKTRHKADIEARRAELQQAAPQASAAADLSQYSEGTRQAIELAAMDYPVSRIARTMGFEPQNVERILAQLKPAIDARKSELDRIKGMKPEAMGFGGGRKADSIVAKMQKSGDMVVNPSADELRAMMRQDGRTMFGDARARGRPLRLLLDSETGDMYAWPAEEVWHFDVARDLNLNAPTTFRATLDPGERLENVSWKDWSDREVGSMLDKKFRQGEAAGREPADIYMDLTPDEIAADMKLRGMTGPARGMNDYAYRRERAMDGVERDPETGTVSWKTRSGKTAKLDPQGMGGADLGLDGFNAKMSRAADGSTSEARETFEKAFSAMEREAIRRNEPLYVITPTRNPVPPEKQALRGGDETRGRERLYLGLLQRLGPPRGYVAAIQKTGGSLEAPPRILLLRADYFNDLVAQGRMSPDDFDIYPPKRGMTPEPEWRRKIGLFGIPAAAGGAAGVASVMGAGEAEAQTVRPLPTMTEAARAAYEEQAPARVIFANRQAVEANRNGIAEDAARHARIRQLLRSIPQAPPVRYARTVDPLSEYDYSRQFDPSYAGYRRPDGDGYGGR